MTHKPVLFCDIEVYHDYFLAAFKRESDGKVVSIEMSRRTDREDDDAKRRRVHGIMLQNRIVTYNGQGYDVPLIFYFINGATNAQLKLASDRIIQGNVRYWEAEKLLGINIPRGLDHYDLMEVQPNAWASLKTLNGRLHGRWLQDLPIEPDAKLSDDDMDLLTRYCGNDLDATELVYRALDGPLDLRRVLSEQYGMNLMSKSDSQAGEGIIKREVERKTKARVERVQTPPGFSFPYVPPAWLRFEHPALKAILDRLTRTEFVVKHNGKVDLPTWLGEAPVRIGDTDYAMGIGGLHSTEKERAVVADPSRSIVDQDVVSYYPNIIMKSGLYPRSLGRSFLEVYRTIVERRVAAKRAGDKVAAEGLKIALNGCFGKLGSPYSILYAPHLMIAVTLTGQLALLMLIDRAEAAGIPVVSANTDGVVFHCPRALEGRLAEITKQWEADTGFELESTRYAGLYSQSVNSYIAVKEDGKVKRKGLLQNPRADGDIRTQMMTSPSMNVCSDAVVEYLTKGVPLEQTIRSRTDVRDFVTVVNVQGGGTWRGEYLGKVVRYVWVRDGEPIFYKKPHPTTGNHKKVPKSDGCRPVMTLPDALPADLDYARYIAEAEEILRNVGAVARPPEPVRVRVYAAQRLQWLAASIAA